MAPKAPAAKKTPKKAPKTPAKKKKLTMQERANVIFPVTRIKRYLRENAGVAAITPTAAIAMAAGLEYIVSELLDVTIHDTLPKGTESKERILPHHLTLTINKDVELKKLFAFAMVRSGGVTPMEIPRKTKPKK